MSDEQILEFLLSNFQAHSVQMNGQCTWRLTIFLEKGKTAKEAIVNTMKKQGIYDHNS